MPPLQSNATLLKVSRGGQREDAGAEEAGGGEGPAAYEGGARVYYRQARERIQTPQGRTITTRRTLHVDARDPAVDWQAEDTVEFLRDGAAAPTIAKVQAVGGAELGEFSGSGVETVKIDLVPE